jgi:phage portal protein BeeE
MPYLQRFIQAFYRDLLKPVEVGKIEIEFATSEFLRGDNETTANYLRSLSQTGIMTLNECRGFLGLDRYDDEAADKLYIQKNMSQIENLDDDGEAENNNDFGLDQENVEFINRVKELRA